MLNTKKSFLLRTMCLLGIVSSAFGSQGEQANLVVPASRADILSSLFQAKHGSPLFVDPCINTQSYVSQGGIVSPLYQAKLESPLYQICSSSQAARTRGEFPRVIGDSLVNAIVACKILTDNEQGSKPVVRKITIENPDNFFITLKSCDSYVRDGETFSQESYWVSDKYAQVSTTLSDFELTIEKLGKKDKKFTSKKLILNSGDCHVVLGRLYDYIFFRVRDCLLE